MPVVTVQIKLTSSPSLRSVMVEIKRTSAYRDGTRVDYAGTTRSCGQKIPIVMITGNHVHLPCSLTFEDMEQLASAAMPPFPLIPVVFELHIIYHVAGMNHKIGPHLPKQAANKRIDFPRGVADMDEESASFRLETASKLRRKIHTPADRLMCTM